ncbi:FtsX-like permease family protein [Alkalibaculum sp. M08DMB]|uniref:FtsX-like permease family protein n=1 Tax=Alkalibaculum sporogenes TaxID=2655001 RepID=A0A6A7KDC1_9FIRM|nr:ABC transporter permease [Alkalibaculum sporogenes]MPW27167.1 FtsX-like permease family protein [Alkalibaculum sporogenes]
MNKLFYAKLAFSNLKKQRSIYLPYILTSILSISMFYIMNFISANNGIDEIPGGDSMRSILILGTYIIGIFSTIFLFYTNSFLIKRRKKEIGLYNILGMEKKHIGKMMFYETIIVVTTSLIAGLFVGILLSKLMFMLLLKILHFSVPMGFTVSIPSLIITGILFLCIFFITLLSNLRQIHVANPIELLRGGNEGEKEPKTKWLLAIIGIGTLGAGYYIALKTDNPLSALTLFFVAVVLVMIGTYALFSAGSIALLKALKKNKTFYYKTKNFTAVSGMIYRMKQNAVGLANICILSTAVLVIISTTVSLYMGMEDVLGNRFPSDVLITVRDPADEMTDRIVEMTKETTKEYGMEVQNFYDYHYLAFAASKDGASFFTDYEQSNSTNGNVSQLYFITVEEYNRSQKSAFTVGDDEVMVYSYRGKYQENEFKIFDKKYRVRAHLQDFEAGGLNSAMITDSYYIIVKDKAVVEELYEKALSVYGENMSDPVYYIGFDLEGSDEEIIACAGAIQDKIRVDYPNAYLENKQESTESFYSIYGGFLFIGIFLGTLFIMATVLIIYYKQISEGYDDKERFEIMQKVGMTKQEVKSAIRSQIITVFSLPIIMAVVHIAFAFKMITKLLQVLNLTNVMLFFYCTVATIIIFAIIYVIVYGLTAKVYYRIVK